MRIVVFFISILLPLSQASRAPAENLPPPESRGVWVTADYLRGGSGSIEALVKNVRAANMNIIYVDVWFRGSTIYPSTVVPAAGGPAQDAGFAGTDPLRMTIDIAHRSGVEVFAWFEYGFAVGYSSNSASPPNILVVHPDWSMVQRDTTKHFDQDSYGNYFFWVDPSVRGAADFVVDLYSECARKYRDLDGIELDRMRYPRTEFSYSETARAQYKAQYGVDPLTLSNTDQNWAKWRRKQVTNVVRRIYQNAKLVNPNCIISGAVVPPYMMAGQGQDKLQEWDVWADSAYVDLLEPMMYLPVYDFGASLPSLKSLVPSNFYLYPGIAVNAAGSIRNTVTEIASARQLGLQGHTIWYYGYLQSGGIDSLRNAAYPSAAMPSHDDLIVDNATPALFAVQGVWTSVSGGYHGSYVVSQAANANVASYAFRILRSGRYSLYGYWEGDSAKNCKTVVVNTKSLADSKTDTVDQSKSTGGWNFVQNLACASGETLSVTVTGTGGGDVIADAFRLRKLSAFDLEDYAVPDSNRMFLRFTTALLDPVPSVSRIYLSDSSVALNFDIDARNNSILRISLPRIETAKPYTLHAEKLVNVNHDTLTLAVKFMYDPDSTVFIVDDTTPLKFTTMGYPWQTQSDSSATGGSCRIIKQTGQMIRAQWGPVQIYKDGYYDVYAGIPRISEPLTGKCLYLVLRHGGSDSVVISQQAAVNGLLSLGNFEYKAGDVAAAMISSVPGADTNHYLVADAIQLRRSVQLSYAKGKRETPLSFRIDQNYPNPFNPTTMISYQLPVTSVVTLKVFDVLGREVITLVNEEQSAGKKEVRWNAAGFSSGIYFYRLLAKGEGGGSIFSGVKKMIILK